jgi:hypothetical protein
VTAGFHLPLRQDCADDALVTDFGGLDLNHAAIDHDDVSDFEILAKVWVVHRDRKGNRGLDFWFAAELNPVTHFELPRFLDITRADAWPREIHEHGDLTSQRG